MIRLDRYSEYWVAMADRVEGLTGTMAVTVEEGMAKRIQGLEKGSVTLFYLPPMAEASASDVDSYVEENECVILVMERYDTQRRTAYDALVSSQPVIEAIKGCMLADLAEGCSPMESIPSTYSIIPETKFYAGFAGWSLGFKART